MGFGYRQAIGELVYPMTICRPDISAAVIKLSQYSAKPAKCHYQALKQVFVYLKATINDGLTYWRTEPNETLPYEAPPPPTTAQQDLP